MAQVSHAVGTIGKGGAILTPAMLRAVPSLYATKPSPKMGENYTFIPTTDVIKSLSDIGMAPTYAAQRKSKKAEFSRHMVRFARKEDLTARKPLEEYPEIVVSNSHNGRAAFMVAFGVFRVVCANGLIVCDQEFGFLKSRHMGDIAAVMQRVEELLSNSSMIMDKLDVMKATKLTANARTDFAMAALAMRYADEDGKVVSPVTAQDLLVPRREADKRTDLWTTYNVVQENMIQGGLIGKSGNGRQVKTRQITDVRKNLSFNMGLWQLAAERVQ